MGNVRKGRRGRERSSGNVRKGTFAKGTLVRERSRRVTGEENVREGTFAMSDLQGYRREVHNGRLYRGYRSSYQKNKAEECKKLTDYFL